MQLLKKCVHLASPLIKQVLNVNIQMSFFSPSPAPSTVVLGLAVQVISCCNHFFLYFIHIPFSLCDLECQAGDVGTLLLVNPVGQNELDHSGLLSEAAKIFGLRSRRLKLYLDQDLTYGNVWNKMADNHKTKSICRWT